MAKRIQLLIISLLTFCMLFSFTACGGQTSSNSSSSNGGSSSTEQPEIVDGFDAPKFSEYEGITSLSEAMKIRFNNPDFETGMTVTSINSTDIVTDGNVDFVVLGNALKPWSILSTTNGKYSGMKKIDLTNIKAQLDIARDKGIEVRAHCLAWYLGSQDEYFPWFFKDDNGNFVDKDEMLKRITNYIDELFATLYDGEGQENYIDVLYDWDVVNESANTNLTSMPTTLAESLRPVEEDFYRRTIGDNYVVEVFKIAEQMAVKHGVDDKIQFTYNDFDTEIDEYKNKAVENIVDALLDAGCKLDNLGFQMHVWYDFDINGLVKTLDTFKDKGVNYTISELDLRMRRQVEQKMSVDEIFQKQAYKYLQILEVCDNYEQVKVLNIWGTIDSTSWLIFGVVGSDYPCLFDGNSNPKPAYWILVDPYKMNFTPQTHTASKISNTPVITDAVFKTGLSKLMGDVEGTFRVVYDDTDAYVYVNIQDSTVDKMDEIRIYFDLDNVKDYVKPLEQNVFVLNRSEMTENADGSGYSGVIKCEGIILNSNNSVGFDILACDNNVAGYWHDMTYTQAGNTLLYGTLKVR